MGDDEITRVYCPNPACNRRVPLGITDACPTCGKDLYDTQRQTAQRSRAGLFAKHAEGLCKKLDSDGRPFAMKLADEGALIVAGFRAWDVAVPDMEERHRQINSLISWQRQIESYLKGER